MTRLRSGAVVGLLLIGLPLYADYALHFTAQPHVQKVVLAQHDRPISNWEVPNDWILLGDQNQSPASGAAMSGPHHTFCDHQQNCAKERMKSYKVAGQERVLLEGDSIPVPDTFKVTYCPDWENDLKVCYSNKYPEQYYLVTCEPTSGKRTIFTHALEHPTMLPRECKVCRLASLEQQSC